MAEDNYEPDYELESILIGDSISLEVLSVVAPPLEYMASLHTNNQEISGRQVWTGSISLAHTLLHLSDSEKRNIFDNRRILELGSGTGILGMAISKICLPSYNPTAIVLTDGDPTAVRLLQSNLEHPNNQVNTSMVQAAHLLWESKDDNSLKFPEFSKWFREAYRSDCEIPLFDSIFAGDVLYKGELPKLFFATAFSLLSKKADSSLWLCHIPRHGVLHSIVVDAAKNAGFAVTTVDSTLQKKVEGCPLDDLQRAITYRMQIDRASFKT